ncbi:hypothetical protein EAV90_15080 [Bradyrhizobium vignae]|nr:hypothetical protein EAV90_15080 [Bradyrhizobium vignae]
MPYCMESHGSRRVTRCAICDGKFGLVRHYSWRTQLCSQNCVDRLKSRRQSDANWMGWLQITSDQPLESRVRAS